MQLENNALQDEQLWKCLGWVISTLHIKNRDNDCLWVKIKIILYMDYK